MANRRRKARPTRRTPRAAQDFLASFRSLRRRAEEILRRATFPLALNEPSEAAYAYRILHHHDALTRHVEAGDTVAALRASFTLGTIIAEADLERAAFSWTRSLKAATATRRENARKWQDRVTTLSAELRDEHPTWTDVRLAQSIHRTLRDRAQRDGDSDRVPSPRSIRRFLATTP